jgi:hypothetical protein
MDRMTRTGKSGFELGTISKIPGSSRNIVLFLKGLGLR